MRIWTQKSASIQKRTSPLKFDDFAEKSEKDTVSYLSTKVAAEVGSQVQILQRCIVVERVSNRLYARVLDVVVSKDQLLQYRITLQRVRERLRAKVLEAVEC